MTFPGLVKANNLSDIGDKEKAWDNLGRNISVTLFATYDPDTIIYLQNMLNIDQQLPEPEVIQAIDNFVVGCKMDGIWTAIKSCCILAGARTLAAALVPLVGAAPTNVGPFASGDYNRKTGLVSNGSTKSLNSNRNNNVDPQNSKHIAVYATTVTTTLNQAYIGIAYGTGFTALNTINSTSANASINSAGAATSGGPGSNAVGLIAGNRPSATLVQFRGGGTTYTNSSSNSETPKNENLIVFVNSPVRLAFYSIGESLDLALLDTRVTALINSIAGAIP
jgi:hypothetical protein